MNHLEQVITIAEKGGVFSFLKRTLPTLAKICCMIPGALIGLSMGSLIAASLGAAGGLVFAILLEKSLSHLIRR